MIHRRIHRSQQDRHRSARIGEAVTEQTSASNGCRSPCLPNDWGSRRRSTLRQRTSQTTCAWPVWWPERCAQNPIPSRTRPLNTPAPMVLCLKTRESRSPPDLPIASPAQPLIPASAIPSTRHRHGPRRSPIRLRPSGIRRHLGAGWSSPVARQAHNLKVTGSNPVPATNTTVPALSHTR